MSKIESAVSIAFTPAECVELAQAIHARFEALRPLSADPEILAQRDMLWTMENRVWAMLDAFVQATTEFSDIDAQYRDGRISLIEYINAIKALDLPEGLQG